MPSSPSSPSPLPLTLLPPTPLTLAALAVLALLALWAYLWYRKADEQEEARRQALLKRLEEGEGARAVRRDLAKRQALREVELRGSHERLERHRQARQETEARPERQSER
jgi:type II secretory pathway component PulJ